MVEWVMECDKRSGFGDGANCGIRCDGWVGQIGLMGIGKWVYA